MILTPKKIRQKLEREFEMDLTAKSRKRDVIYKRCVAFKLCRDFTRHSLAELGEEFGKDHATVIHSLNSFDLHENQYYFKNYKKVYDRYTQMFMELTERKAGLEFTNEIKEIKELKYAFIVEKQKIEEDLNTFYSAKISALQKKIDIYEKYSFFDKIVTLPIDEFLELKERINAFFVMNGMNYQRKMKRLKKQTV